MKLYVLSLSLVTLATANERFLRWRLPLNNEPAPPVVTTPPQETPEPLPPPDYPPDESCDPNWQTLQQQWQQAYSVWNKQDKSCYTMTLIRNCFCPPDWRGPHNVRVENGVVVVPLDYYIPTMDEIFDTIYNRCIAGCPDDGAVQCEATFAAAQFGAYVTQMYYDQSRFIADEELGYVVSNLTFC
jgi:hypothetical protein